MAKQKRRKRRRPSSSQTGRTNTRTKKRNINKILCFQDVWDEHCSNRLADDGAIDADAVSNLFFELANAPSVSYRLVAPPSASASLPRPSSEYRGNKNKMTNKNKATATAKDVDAKIMTKPPPSNTIVIEQDILGAAETHTGGIVWETSYLLLNYLLSSKSWLNTPPNTDDTAATHVPRTVLEIGAGCGLLGLSIHKAFEMGIIDDDNNNIGAGEGGGGSTLKSRVILTETNEVMDNLRRNLARNYPPRLSREEAAADDDANVTSSGTKMQQQPSARNELSAEELDWTRCQEDCARAGIEAHSVDCIIGTDVVFSTRFVLPMLETMRWLSHPRTSIYLCLQERCKDSHELLLKETSRYGFDVEDISESVYNDPALSPSCGFGRALDCKLLKFIVIEMEEKDAVRKMKKKSKKKEKEKSEEDKEKKN